MGYNILIAEDDVDIITLLTLYLESAGYNVITAQDGVKACEIMDNEKIDMAILDIMMPKMDGYQLTKRIRENSNIPIIILSAKTQDSDKILGLNIGADDYLTKPFNPMEVVARVNSNLRRYCELGAEPGSEKQSNILEVGGLVMDLETFRVTKDGETVELTPMEMKILGKLMQSPGRVFTKMQIYESVSGDFFESDDNTMMVHISKLREKIEDNPKEPKYIKTIRGLGYKIEG